FSDYGTTVSEFLDANRDASLAVSPQTETTTPVEKKEQTPAKKTASEGYYDWVRKRLLWQ
ncbi:MAG: hypothetical protein FWE67_11885, partial [Planctomycetaceae bacterium]|nr:hypothetical protein [Planctomycetaceae bacterium]